MDACRLRFVVNQESAVNALLIAYVALTPLLVIPVAGQLGASDVLFFPALALFALVAKVRRLGWAHVLMAAFLLLTGVSLVATQDFQYVVKWGRLIGIVLPFFLVPFSTVTINQVARVFFFSGLATITIAVVLWWFDIVLFADESNQRIWLGGGESRVRAAGLFGNSGAFGALIAMWTVICTLHTLCQPRPDKLVLATILCSTTVALLASTSRASLMAMAAGIGVGVACLTWARCQQGGLKITARTVSLVGFAAVVFIACVGFVIMYLMDAQLREATIARFDPFAHRSSNSFLSGRIAIWSDYLESIEKWGLFGVGYKQGHLHFASTPHNQFLSLAAESGFPSLILFVLWSGNLVAVAVKRYRRQPIAAAICLSVMAAFVADGMGGEPLASWQVTPITMIVLGICLRTLATSATETSRSRPELGSGATPESQAAASTHSR